MNIGNGSLGLVKAGKASGSPFTSTSAKNGNSIDISDGTVVLGNDQADIANPAQLLNGRKILMNLFGLQLSNGNIANGNFGVSALEIEGALITKKNVAIFQSLVGLNQINDSFGVFIGQTTSR